MTRQRRDLLIAAALLPALWLFGLVMGWDYRRLLLLSVGYVFLLAFLMWKDWIWKRIKPPGF